MFLTARNQEASRYTLYLVIVNLLHYNMFWLTQRVGTQKRR